MYFCGMMVDGKASGGNLGEGEIRVLTTDDGSRTLYLPGMDETYHSTHGAVTESSYVYIERGLDCWRSENPGLDHVRVFEMGLGTGTNALLAMEWCERWGISMDYFTVEKFPLSETLMRDYWGDTGYAERSEALHAAPWEQWVDIPLPSGQFKLFKHQSDIQQATVPDQVDVVFWDAFGPKKQEGVWGEALFVPIYEAMDARGMLVTYSAAGEVKRSLKSVGFVLEKLDGPPFKRHMLRARKG
jgi:tRNA U34 5-methylaminomethyl-2-thiouridine-forming methyltransferase MnmC